MGLVHSLGAGLSGCFCHPHNYLIEPLHFPKEEKHMQTFRTGRVRGTSHDVVSASTGRAALRLRTPLCGRLILTGMVSMLAACSVSELSGAKKSSPKSLGSAQESSEASNGQAGNDSVSFGMTAMPSPQQSSQLNATAQQVPSNFTLIRQPETIALGEAYRGRGTSVVMIDDGVDYTVPALGSCSLPGSPASCRVPASLDFSDGKNGTPYKAVAGNHGTTVAAVVADLAPETKIIGLNIYSASGSILEYVLNAVNWAIANKSTYNIVAMHISINATPYTSVCDSAGGIITTFSDALKRARSAGIVPVIGSGEAGRSDAISVPACLSAAVSVGAVDNNDVVQSFSNSASFLTLLAPGKDIPAAGLIGTDTFFAAAHIAGAAAILRGLFPSESVDQTLSRMRDRGVLITDSRNGLLKPRLDLYAAAQGDSGCNLQVSPQRISVDTRGGHYTVNLNTGSQCPWKIKGPNQPPFVTVTPIEGKGSQVINIVASANTADDATRFNELIVEITGTTVSQTIRLIQGAAAIKCRITVDPTSTNVPATGGTYPIRINTSEPGCNWGTSFSGVDRSLITLSAYTGTGPATIQATVARNDSSSARTPAFAVVSLDSGAATVRVEFLQMATDISPPTNGELRINGGAAWTNSRTVGVQYRADDPNGVAKVCLSTSRTSCTRWVAIGGPISITLTPNAQNVMTVYGWFEDGLGNRTTTPVSASIGYDTQAPTVATISTSKTSTSISLAWAAATDRQSGVGSYKLVYLQGSSYPAAKCTNGTIAPATASGAIIAGLSPNKTYRFRLCVSDNAGNIGDRIVNVTTNR